MEDYLQYMKTLRSQINDVEDQATNISVEEQMHLTTIDTLEKDLVSANSEKKRLMKEMEQMVRDKGQVCSQIIERQKKIAFLESDSSTLIQSLELIHQERTSISRKLKERSAYYIKTAKDINARLEEQQDWSALHKFGVETGIHGMAKDKDNELVDGAEENSAIECHLFMDNMGNDASKTLMFKLDSAEAKLAEIRQMKAKLVQTNSQICQDIEQARCSVKDFQPEIRTKDITTLEEEYNALLSDKVEVTNFVHSLQNQIANLKGISHTITCACGNNYKVEMDLYA